MLKATKNLGLGGLTTALTLGLLIAPASAASTDTPHQTAQRQGITKVSCASLDGPARAAAWVGTNNLGGWCYVGEGTANIQFGFNVHSYCAGEFNSLISYKWRGDPVMYYQTARAYTCQPFDHDLYTIYQVKRYR